MERKKKAKIFGSAYEIVQNNIIKGDLWSARKGIQVYLTVAEGFYRFLYKMFSREMLISFYPTHVLVRINSVVVVVAVVFEVSMHSTQT